MRSASSLALTLLTLGCACCGGGNTGTTTSTGGSTSGTTSGSGTGGAYTVITIDANADKKTIFNMAISSTDQIGVVFFRDGGGQYEGTQNKAVTYTEINGGAITIPPETVNTVQLIDGCTVAFQPGGAPAVGYLGGGVSNFDAGPMASLYWFQSQAEIDYRQSGGTWNQDICMLDSMGGSCVWPNASCMVTAGAGGPFNWHIIDGNPPADDTEAEQLCDNPFGTVVGLWPALLFDGGTAEMVVRDVHEGQFPIQDWGGSDAKMCIGGPGGTSWSWTAPLTISNTTSHKTNGFGTHNQILFAQGLIAEISDSDPKDQGFDSSGAGPLGFTIQTGSSTDSTADWTLPIDPFDPTATQSGNLDTSSWNPGTGPSMIYSPLIGFGVVAGNFTTTDQTPVLYYTACTSTPLSVCADSTMNPWSTPEIVYDLGSGGFYPDLQINPVTDNPVVSYLVCALEPSFDPDTGCDPNRAELDISERSAEGWNASTVMKGSFYHPRFGYLSTGKKVFVYSDLVKGGLYAAIEN